MNISQLNDSLISNSNTSGVLNSSKGEKTSRYLLDLIKNQIRITDEFQLICKNKVREKDLTIASLSRQRSVMIIVSGSSTSRE